MNQNSDGRLNIENQITSLIDQFYYESWLMEKLGEFHWFQMRIQTWPSQICNVFFFFSEATTVAGPRSFGTVTCFDFDEVNECLWQTKLPGFSFEQCSGFPLALRAASLNVSFEKVSSLHTYLTRAQVVVL